jgi:hypothetical protein
MVIASFTMVFAILTMIFVGSTMVFVIKKMLSILDHLSTESAPISHPFKIGISIMEKTGGEVPTLLSPSSQAIPLFLL